MMSDKGLGPAFPEFVPEPYEPSELAEADDVHVPQDDVTGVFLDECVATDSISLPIQMPRSIWDEGVRSETFSDGILVSPEFRVSGFGNLVSAPFLDEWVEQIADCSRELKRLIPVISSNSFADVVKHTTYQKWREECESLLHSALKRWILVVTSFQHSAVVWKQLASETSDVKKIVVLADNFSAKMPASPSTVGELYRIHQDCWARIDWNSVVAGALLFVIYSRARWAGASHSDKLYPDCDAEGVTTYLEASAAVCKTIHASLYQNRVLPLIALGVGMVDEPWFNGWMMRRTTVGVQPTPFNPMMPAPSGDGKACQRWLSSTEAGAWLRRLLYVYKMHLKGRHVSAHSLEATTLSHANEFGFAAETRLQLACHVGGFKMQNTYSHDAAPKPVLELDRVLGRSGTGPSDQFPRGVVVFPQGILTIA